jgi:hypothetical protein
VQEWFNQSRELAAKHDRVPNAFGTLKTRRAPTSIRPDDRITMTAVGGCACWVTAERDSACRFVGSFDYMDNSLSVVTAQFPRRQAA